MDSALLSILACPKCRGPLVLLRRQDKDSGLECVACAVVYPINNDIPALLIEKAVALQAWEQDSAKE